MLDIKNIEEWSVAILLTVLVIIAMTINNTVRKLKYSSIATHSKVLCFALLVLCTSFWIKVIIQFM